MPGLFLQFLLIPFLPLYALFATDWPGLWAGLRAFFSPELWTIIKEMLQGFFG